MTEPEQRLEPAQHDHPDGAVKGWDASELGSGEAASDEQIAEFTTLAADGGTHDDDLDGGDDGANQS